MNIEIANRLQKLRKENGYSQEELADKLGISRQAVSKWERAESSPDTDNLIVLARLYHISLDELLYDNESNEEIRDRVADKTQDEEVGDSISLTDDEGQTVKVQDGHIRFYNKDGSEQKLNKKEIIIKSATDGAIAVLTLAAFLIWGFAFNGWHICWIVWIIMPGVMSLVDAIMKKQFTAFALPCPITALYLYLGMEFGLWHPYWFLFLTIPIYYIIADPIDKYVLKTKKEDDNK